VQHTGAAARDSNRPAPRSRPRSDLPGPTDTASNWTLGVEARRVRRAGVVVDRDRARNPGWHHPGDQRRVATCRDRRRHMHEPNGSRRRTRRASNHARREGRSCGQNQKRAFHSVRAIPTTSAPTTSVSENFFMVPPDLRTLGEREGSPSTSEPVWKARSVCYCRAARDLLQNKCRTDCETPHKNYRHVTRPSVGAGLATEEGSGRRRVG
jgi:hypothetical protein